MKVVDNMYVRKDSTPKDTIKRIQLLLQNLNISIQTAELIEFDEGWASQRLEIEGIPGIGTNGKGVNRTYATASAYAELMERLSSGYLVHQYYPRMIQSEQKKNDNSLQSLVHALKLLDRYPEYQINTQMHNVIGNNHIYQKLERYYNIFGDKYEFLPQWFIDANCGSNGLCAGNTVEEAVLQGINEVQERYARKCYFKDLVSVNTIPDDDLRDLQSWKMILLIRDLGYHCVVKDFTGNGSFPVLQTLK